MGVFDYSKLRGRMAEMGVSQEHLAKQIHMSLASLNNKLMGKTEFRQSEIKAICVVLEIPLSDVWLYFFSPKTFEIKSA